MSSQTKVKKPGYINNAELRKKVIAHLDACKAAEKAKKLTPPVPNDVALAIYNIAERFSSKPCYVSYQFREDMVAEAVKNCLEYIRNVDPSRPNVFGYFTQIIQYAFWRYIKKEKKYLYSKFKLMQHVGAMSETQDLHEHDDSKRGLNEEVKYGDEARNYVDNFITEYELKQAQQKAKLKEAKKAKLASQNGADPLLDATPESFLTVDVEATA